MQTGTQQSKESNRERKRLTEIKSRKSNQRSSPNQSKNTIKIKLRLIQNKRNQPITDRKEYL